MHIAFRLMLGIEERSTAFTLSDSLCRAIALLLYSSPVINLRKTYRRQSVLIKKIKSTRVACFAEDVLAQT